MNALQVMDRYWKEMRQVSKYMKEWYKDSSIFTIYWKWSSKHQFNDLICHWTVVKSKKIKGPDYKLTALLNKAFLVFGI